MLLQNKYKISGLLAVSPIIVFLCVYLITSIVVGDFYIMPISVAFIIASAYALIITKGIKFDEKLTLFSKGAGHENIILMIWIYILAGAFAQSAKAMGAIDTTVNLTLMFVPDYLLLAGIFIASCFISLSIGTSVGTIVALVPMAVGIAEKMAFPVPYMVAVIVGGAFFGDNLSFISDTTIAATKTQGCLMKDKFRVNSKIVIPAALLVFIWYIIKGFYLNNSPEIDPVNWIQVIPYLTVLVTAAAGINVMIVLIIGIILTGIIGLGTGGFTFFEYLASLGKGITSMGEISIIALLAGGLLEMIRYNGGINYIIKKLTSHVNTKRGAEFSLALLVSLANFCTANNTIAIITVGSIAKNISQKYGISPMRSASILDTFSCLIQGIIPYGAQMLLAASLASLSPVSIIKYLYYPMVMGVFAIGAIAFDYPKISRGKIVTLDKLQTTN